MHGRGTAFIFKSMLTINNPLAGQKRFFSYDPLNGFEPWNPQSPTSPFNPANPIYQEMMKPREANSRPIESKKKKSNPAPAPDTDERQSGDHVKLRADY